MDQGTGDGEWDGNRTDEAGRGRTGQQEAQLPDSRMTTAMMMMMMMMTTTISKEG
jgi:hypothetical protein